MISEGGVRYSSSRKRSVTKSFHLKYLLANLRSNKNYVFERLRFVTMTKKSKSCAFKSHLISSEKLCVFFIADLFNRSLSKLLLHHTFKTDHAWLKNN